MLLRKVQGLAVAPVLAQFPRALQCGLQYRRTVLGEGPRSSISFTNAFLTGTLVTVQGLLARSMTSNYVMTGLRPVLTSLSARH